MIAGDLSQVLAGQGGTPVGKIKGQKAIYRLISDNIDENKVPYSVINVIVKQHLVRKCQPIKS